MFPTKNLFFINGSASRHAANEKILAHLGRLLSPEFRVSIFNELKSLPHFDPELSTANPPSEIIAFRNRIAAADGLVFCTPEYVFSIPSGLKNALEWCVATTLFTGKPTGIITASASGRKGHAELQLILKTLGACCTPATTLLIPGVKGKVNEAGDITDGETLQALAGFVYAFQSAVKNS